MREDQHLLRNSERGGSEGESGVFWRHLRKRTASKLEDKTFHKLVLALVRPSDPRLAVQSFDPKMVSTFSDHH